MRPLVPYARALIASGHQVAVAAPMDCAAILRKSDIEHLPFAGITKEQITAIWTPHWAKNVTRDAMLRIALPEMFVGAMARVAMDGLGEIAARWRPDVIVRESMEFAGLVVADASGIPHVRVNVHNSDVEARAIGFAVDALDLLRIEAGLAPDKGSALLDEPAFTSFPAGFDGDVLQGADSAPFRVWSNSNGSPPNTDWSSNGNRPLLYVTFGTMVGARQGRDNIFRVALDAVAELDVEVLMTTGPDYEISTLGTIPDNAVIRGFVPQASVFPQATAMLCHGGSGTLLGGFSAGLPQVIAPHSADQPYNADRTEAGGFGLHVDASSSEEMHRAVVRVIENPKYSAAARQLAEEMRALPDHRDAGERFVEIA